MWELTLEARVRMGGGGQWGKNWDNYNRIPTKNDLIKLKLLVKKKRDSNGTHTCHHEHKSKNS